VFLLGGATPKSSCLRDEIILPLYPQTKSLLEGAGWKPKATKPALVICVPVFDADEPPLSIWREYVANKFRKNDAILYFGCFSLRMPLICLRAGSILMP
jgi:hypothetical protein